MKSAFGLALFCALVGSARAQVGDASAAAAVSAPDSSADDSRVTLRQKTLAGNQGYWLTDTYVDASLPRGFDVNADFNAYQDASSTMTTPTVTVGGSWTDGYATLFASYGLTGRANDLEANSTDVGATLKTPEEDFRTALTLDVNVTHQFIFGLGAAGKQFLFDMTERTPTVTLTQRFFDALDASVALSQSSYNNLGELNLLGLNPRRRYVLSQNAALAGLVQGFPDWTAKYGLKYAFAAVPATLQASYETLQFANTTFAGTHTSADVENYVGDYDVLKWLTLGVEYQHYRQTSQPAYDQYGGSLEVRF